MPRDGAGLHLFPGSRVAIVGGGPAASFAALHLLRFARQWDGRQSRLHQLWGRGWWRVLLTETRLPTDRRLGHRALWRMLTGDEPTSPATRCTRKSSES